VTDYITSIEKLKPPYDETPEAAVDMLAEFVNETYGNGGLPGDPVFENRLGYVNTTVSHGYIRTPHRQSIWYGAGIY
jgi:hypothetical protein